MTPHQKSFQKWIERFKEVCRFHGGNCVEFGSAGGDYSVKYEFDSKFGRLTATMFEGDYDCEVKRGFVSIYLKFNHEVDVGKIAPLMFGEFNKFSGKWNIHVSGDKKDLENIRESAIRELVKRLEFIEAKAGKAVCS